MRTKMINLNLGKNSPIVIDDFQKIYEKRYILLCTFERKSLIVAQKKFISKFYVKTHDLPWMILSKGRKMHTIV